MDCFELLQKHLAMCAIEVSQKPTKNHPFNVRNLTVFSSVCVTVGLILGSWNEDNTFDEHTDLLFRSLSIGAGAIVYAIIVCNTSKLSAFINSLADTVRASEKTFYFRLQNAKFAKYCSVVRYNAHWMCVGSQYAESQPLYTKISRKVGKWIQFLDFVCLKVTPLLCVNSSLIASYLTYFTTDLGETAFELPLPMW